MRRPSKLAALVIAAVAWSACAPINVYFTYVERSLGSTSGSGGAKGTGGAMGCVPADTGTGETVWAEGFADPSDEQGNAIATDAAGNVLVTGYVAGSADFGGGVGTLTAGPGEQDIFVAKLDPSGEMLWAKLLVGSNGAGTAITSDPAGNVLVTGYASGTFTVGAATLVGSGGNDVFVAKLDPSGAPVWAHVFGDANDDQATGIGTDSAGNVFVTGFVNGNVDFGGGMLTSGGAEDIFVAELGPGGALVWASLYGDPAASQQATALAVDGDGAVLVTGMTSGATNFGAGALQNPTHDAIFVAKFHAGCALAWATLYGCNGPCSATGIATDSARSVLLTGSVSGPIDFGGGTLPPTDGDGPDAFVAKFDTSGAPAWAQRFTLMDGTAESIRTDPCDNVVVTGAFYGVIAPGSGTLTSAGSSDVFVAKFAPSGTALWSRRFGDPAIQTGLGVTTDLSSNIFVTGWMQGTVGFGASPPVMAAGGADIFVAKLSP